MRVDDRIDGPSAAYASFSRGAIFLLVIFTLSTSSAEALINPILANDAQQRVLILHAYNYTFPATTAVSEAARTRLQERSPKKLEIEGDFLDLARLPDEAHASRLANFLSGKYAGVHFDVVMALGVPAMPFLLKYRDTIAPGVPIVFAGGTRAEYEAMKLPPDITGVISEFHPEKIIDLAEYLQPDARQIVVIGGSSELDRPWQDSMRKAIAGRQRTFETIYLFNSTYDAILTTASKLPRNTIVILLTVFADSAGRSLIPREVAAAIAKASSAPVYGPFETFVGSGIVGGYTETYATLGTATADAALEVLSGLNPATLPLRTNPGQAFRVDARAMERWGLQQANLPPGSIVAFKQPRFWDEHRDLALVVALVIGLQSLVLAALLFQRHRRRQAEASLKESDERMTFAAASANVGLWQFNRTTDELWATEHCRAMFGLAKDVALTRDTFLSVIHLEDRDIAVNALRESGTARQSAVTHVRVMLQDEQVRWISIRTRAIPDDLGTPDRLSGIFVDITEQKDAAAEAALQRQEVTHLMRVSVLGELSGAIAHEVNQPLTAILSNAQAALYLLAQESPNLTEVREALQDIVQEDNRAGEVVHRLRGLLKKGETRSEPINVHELVDSTVTLLRTELVSRRIAIAVDMASDLPTISGDFVQLQQVLINLIMNAMDAMAATPVAQRLIAISARATTTGFVEVLVKDRGPAIDPAEYSRLFAPFYTTKNHGLGLGLTICSTIVRAHGGKMSLSRDDAGGTVAELSLPVQEMLMAAQ